MREILFRGKRVDNGTWAYGDLVHCDDEMEINSESHGENGGYIIPETVGQYTGLTDKNGKKVFEGDIVSIKCADGKSRPFPVYYGTYNVDGYGEDFHIGFYAKYFDEDVSLGFLTDNNAQTDFEVIGNIFDNSLEEET